MEFLAAINTRSAEPTTTRAFLNESNSWLVTTIALY